MDNTELQKRKRLRLKDFDYNSSGWYFVTVCVKDMRFPVLSHIIVGNGALDIPQSKLTTAGTITEKYILDIMREGWVNNDGKFVETANEMIARSKRNSKSKLSQIRKARGFTQAELANASGITLRMVQLYEQKQNDINKAQADTVLALSKALGCDIQDILELRP